MQLEAFRVENYKKVKDSGWVECGDITAFVGKNEAGKSALFRGLSKMNSSDGEEYDGLVEFPRSRYSDEFAQKDWPVSTVKFRLEDEEQEQLKQICPELNQPTHAIVTRYYSNQYTSKFESMPSIPNISINSYRDFLYSLKSKLSTTRKKLDEVSAQKLTEATNSLDQIIQEINAKESSELINEETIQQVSLILQTDLDGLPDRQLRSLRSKHNKFSKFNTIYKKIDEAETWIINNMPQFVYFDKYNVIDSAIHIRKFLNDIKETPHATRLRTTKCLFEHVGLSIEEISELDPVGEDPTEELERRFRERHIRVSSASSSMTNKFGGWWDQRKYGFRYDVDGQFFRVWVSDDLDPSEIELDQRSAGMQYFFSFYLVFLVEADRGHKNSILLLDEPGLHYHGTAQKKAVEFLQKIAHDNQLLYTTHSPFMIDGNKLDDVRIVYEDKQTGHTAVSTDIWPKDPDALFPLQAGLGYTLAQTLFYSKNNLIVEGITDYLILNAVNEHLKMKGMTALDANIAIIPVGGVSKMMPLASLLVGNNLKLVVLLDGDEPGIRKANQLKTELMVDHILISDFISTNVAELEDLFLDLYMNAVHEAYPNCKVQFTDVENATACITKRVSAAFERLGYDKFAKWRVANVLVDRIRKDENGDEMEEVYRVFEQLFNKINQKFTADGVVTFAADET